MTSRRLLESLLSHRPYFGPAMRALQGVPIRHAYMQAVVELLSKKNHGEKLNLLEVGSWAGGSAITWAKAIKKYFGDGQIVCVDHWQPYFDNNINSDTVYSKMNEAAENGSIYGLFLHNIKASRVSDIISPVIGNSHDVLPALKKNDFSIVYLDASHSYRDVAEDIRLSIGLVKDGGILCGDDLELQSFEVDASVLAEDIATEKDYVKSRSSDIYYHPGVTHAVAEAFGEVSVWEGFWAVRKTARGWEKIDISDCEIEIPEHISTAELFSTNPSDVEAQTLNLMGKLANQINNPSPPSSVPNLLGSYRGFNVVLLHGHYYGVRQALGEIDWSSSRQELLKRYDKADLFSCNDAGSMLCSIGIFGFELIELLPSVGTLSSVVVESVLRQEGLMADLANRLNSLENEARNQVGRYDRLLHLNEDRYVGVHADVGAWYEVPTNIDVSVRDRDPGIIRRTEAGTRAYVDRMELSRHVTYELNQLKTQVDGFIFDLKDKIDNLALVLDQSIADLQGKIDSIKNDDLVRLSQESQNAVGQLKCVLQDQIDNLQHNALVRAGFYITKNKRTRKSHS